MTYDTEQVYRVARKISSLSREIQQLSRSKVNQMQSKARGALVGDAGDALREELSVLGSRSDALSRGLDQISATLLAYAKKLEEIDRKTKELVRGR